MKAKLLYIVLISMIIISCNKTKDKYQYLDRSIWFEYQKYDTLRFQSNNSNFIDLYIISNLYTAFEEYDNKYYNEYFCVQYSCLSDSVFPPLYGFCRKRKEIIINTRDSWTGTGYDSGEKLNYQLGNYLIKDVYKIIATRVDSYYYPIKTYYYSDIYGIIRYDMYNDEIFELQLK